MSEEIKYETKRIDHLGIVAGVCHEIDLIPQVDAALGPCERKVSCGHAVQAMVLNALGFSGRALYLMPDYLANKPVELLIGDGLNAEDFNDDSLGQTLDDLYEAGVTEVFARVAAFNAGAQHLTLPFEILQALIEDQYSYRAVAMFTDGGAHLS